MKATNALSLAIAAGCIASPAMANNTPVQKQGTFAKNMVGHIYFNVATGEKIGTVLSDDIRPVDGVNSSEVWVADNNTPCAAFGQTSGTAVVLDNPNDFFGTGSTSTGTTMLDWGDVPQDTVIDCVQVDWFSFVPDTDTDSDGLGDGVEGFAATWSFFDGDNGFNTCLTRQGLIAFTFFGLAGSFDGSFSGYLLTVDLAGDFSSSISFEYGDSDSDLQGAAFHNPLQYISDIDSDGLPDGDLDSDGLADISYAYVYIQPGTVDFDNADGDSDTTTGVDGDPLNQELTATGLAAPRGTTNETDNGDGTFSYDITPDAGPNATGAEEGWDEFDSAGFYDATYWMGGFSCNSDGLGDINAFSQMDMIMYTPGAANPCPADFTGDGLLDVFDVFAFLDLFNAGDLSADFTNDGILDVFDVFAFLDAFNAGCP
ncbi:MAG: hypothetical protein KC996_06590 [Phycisphaerales bacterium]|nr:hypothetical protein [Phycisphaerales bacterium]